MELSSGGGRYVLRMFAGILSLLDTNTAARDSAAAGSFGVKSGMCARARVYVDCWRAKDFQQCFVLRSLALIVWVSLALTLVDSLPPRRSPAIPTRIDSRWGHRRLTGGYMRVHMHVCVRACVYVAGNVAY